MYRCHVAEQVGSKEVGEIKRPDIQRLLIDLPPQTSQMTLAMLKSLYREALAQEVVTQSPVHGLKGQQVIVKPRKFLTWEQLSKLSFGKYTTQIHFMALHGLRWSEAVALKDEDFRDGKIYVSRSIHGATKSRAGVRVVPQISEFKKLPKTRRPLRRVLAPHGLTIHSLRYTYAYLLKSRAVHVTTAQRLLGHSDPRVTLAIYTQVLDDELEKTGEVLKNSIALESNQNLANVVNLRIQNLGVNLQSNFGI